MRLTVSDARSNLSEIILRVQDPDEYCVLDRYGKPVAAIVSMKDLERIWQIEDQEERGMIRNPLCTLVHVTGRPLTGGVDGKTVNLREAANQVRTLQLTRREERRVLARGGLEPVEGGELLMDAVAEVRPKRRWFGWLRRR